MAKGAKKSVTGFELFKNKIEETIDYRNNHTKKPKWMSNEAARELQKSNNHHNCPAHVTDNGARVWSF